MTRRLILAMLLAAAPAIAQPDSKEQAKSHFKQARAFQETGAYARAAEEYKAAYALDPRPETLFNIAQAYRLAGDKPAALDYFKQYVTAQPNGQPADEARTFIAALEKQIADEKAAAPPPTGPPPTTAPVLPPPTPERRDTIFVRRSRTLQIAGVATAGVGVVTAGFGVKFGLDARDADDYFSTHTGGWGPGDEQRFLDGRAANRNMIIAYVVAGGLVATGAVLFAIGSSTHAVPIATGDSVGVALAGEL